jgi:hypothetical protein
MVVAHREQLVGVLCSHPSRQQLSAHWHPVGPAQAGSVEELQYPGLAAGSRRRGLCSDLEYVICSSVQQTNWHALALDGSELSNAPASILVRPESEGRRCMVTA